jgi:hypothetical protein
VAELRTNAINIALCGPAKTWYRAHGREVDLGDVDVHGVQIFRALLAAALGCVADRAPLWHDQAKAAPWFMHPSATNCSVAPALRQQALDTRNKQHNHAAAAAAACACACGGETLHLLRGGTPLECANSLLAPGAHHARTAALPYLDTFAALLAQDALLLPLINVATQPQHADATARILGIDTPSLNTTLWKVDPDDCTNVEMDRDKASTLLRAIGIFK